MMRINNFKGINLFKLFFILISFFFFKKDLLLIDNNSIKFLITDDFFKHLNYIFFKILNSDFILNVPFGLFITYFLIVFISIGVIFSLNAISSLMFLILTYVLSSIVLILFGLEFMGLLLIIVYVGAVAVLFLFVIMMLRFEKVSEYKSNKISSIFFKIIFFISIFLYSFLFYNLCSNSFLNNLKYMENSPYNISVNLNKDYLVKKSNFFNINFEMNSYESSNIILSKYLNLEDLPYNDIENLGIYFYTDYSYIFLLCGVILLVSIVAPILLTYKNNSNIKKQQSFNQIERKKIVSIDLKDL